MSGRVEGLKRDLGCTAVENDPLLCYCATKLKCRSALQIVLAVQSLTALPLGIMLQRGPDSIWT